MDFGLERETLARFLPATDATELAATQMLDDAPKQNARRLVSCSRDAIPLDKLSSHNVYLGSEIPSGRCSYE